MEQILIFMKISKKFLKKNNKNIMNLYKKKQAKKVINTITKILKNSYKMIYNKNNNLIINLNNKTNIIIKMKKMKQKSIKIMIINKF